MRTVEATPNSEAASTRFSNELEIHYLISAATSTPGGKITASIAWITPFEAGTSAETTVAPLTVTPLRQNPMFSQNGQQLKI